jgi:selenocysteine lyase/cysteine desulfurase
VSELATYLRERLSSTDCVDLHDQGRRQCGIVSFSFDGLSAAEVQQRLSGQGINVSVSIADYARLDLPPRGLTELVRASVHYYNTEAEIDQLIDGLSTDTAPSRAAHRL